MSVRFAARLARLLRRWASRLAPEEIPASPAEPVPVGGVRFEVVRTHHGIPRTLYSGPSGAKARDRFLKVKRDNQPGVVRLLMDGAVRDFHTEPPT
jgi:hypothetical protein